MNNIIYKDRVRKCCRLMRTAGPWGVRVEDTVVVGKEGPVILTHYPRHLGR